MSRSNVTRKLAVAFAFVLIAGVISACVHKRGVRQSEESVSHRRDRPKPLSASPNPAPAAKTVQTKPAATKGPVQVEVVKQVLLGESIESFFANVYTKRGPNKAYLATRIPCEASVDDENKVGQVDCRYNDESMAINIEIEKRGARTAKLAIPGEPERELRCQVKYDYKSDRSHGPEATRSGSVLHRLKEVNCL